MAGLQAGDAFPEGVTFSYLPNSSSDGDSAPPSGSPQTFDASSACRRGKVVLVSVPGAFTPVCQAAHLPSFLARRDALRAKGVDRVVVLACNDAYVMAGWARANGVVDDFVIFASDTDAKFSKAIGWTLGERTARYAVVVDRGTVVYAGLDSDPGSVDQSGAAAVLNKL